MSVIEVVRNEIFIPKPNEVAVLVRKASGRDKMFCLQKNLRTNVGVDFQKNQMSGTVAAVANYIALSTVNTAPAVTDTASTFNAAETTTNGLARATGTYAAGASGVTNYTLQKLFTYTGTGTITIFRAGMFNTATANTGVLFFETLFASSAVMEQNDTITVTWTVNV